MGRMSGTDGKEGGGSKTKKAEQLGWRDYTFIDVPLDVSEVEIFREDYSGESVDVVGFIDDWAARGYKFSASPDSQGGGGMVSLTAKASGDVNYGFILTARASTCGGAIKLLIYLDLVICGEKPWKQVHEERGGRGSYIV